MSCETYCETVLVARHQTSSIYPHCSMVPYNVPRHRPVHRHITFFTPYFPVHPHPYHSPEHTIFDKHNVQTHIHIHTRRQRHSLPHQMPQNHNFQPLAIAKIGYTFNISTLLTTLRTKKGNLPWHFGVALNMLLYYIPPLVSSQLDNAVDYTNKVPSALMWAEGYTNEVDMYIAYLRLTDGLSEKFEGKGRAMGKGGSKKARKYVERYVYMVEAMFKAHVREELADLFTSWSEDETRLFNKGVDKALSDIQWCVYPGENVVFAAGEGDWAVWIEGRCEGLGDG